jgi:acyl carrier protein
MEEYLPGMLSKTNEVFAIPQPANSRAEVPAIQPISTLIAAAMISEVIPSATISAAVDAAAIEKHVLAVVSEKTGYPPEMLDLELDLEADLGVDTVKQAELFAAIRTHYGIPRREDLRLSDYNTLKKVIGFVTDSLAQGNVAVADEKPVEKLSEVTLVKDVPSISQDSEPKPYQGIFFLSANNRNNLQKGLISAISDIKTGKIPPSVCPPADQVKKSERIAIDYSDQAELIKRCEKALSALESDAANAWQALQAQGIYRGSGNPGKVVFMFPGQGSQYVNMLRDLYKTEQVVADTFNEADRVMTPILGRSLTSFIYVEGDEEALAQAEKDLKNTAITQPAMLTANVALLRLMNKYGFEP